MGLVHQLIYSLRYILTLTFAYESPSSSEYCNETPCISLYMPHFCQLERPWSNQKSLITC